LSNIDGSNIWQAAKYMKRSRSFANIPNLTSNDSTFISFEEQTTAFHSTFFPPPPTADTSDMYNSDVLFVPSTPFEDITLTQIERAVNKMAPNNAPGPDNI